MSRRFLQYMSALDPAFRLTIRGASRDEITHLQSIAGHTLPPDYREYLELMGQHDNGALSDREVRTDISDVISFYEESVSTGEDSVPDDCVAIGVGGATLEQIDIEFEGLCRVFESADGRKSSLWAESLETRLHQRAYMRYRPGQLAHTAFYTSSDPTPFMDAARAEALRLGFVPHWFSGAITFCGEREGAVLILNQFERQGLCMRAAATHAEALDAVARRIAEGTGVALRRCP